MLKGLASADTSMAFERWQPLTTRSGWHVLFAAQKAVGSHAMSFMHVVGQAAFAPSHRNRPHAALTAPALLVAQVPSTAAPAFTLHTSQPPAQAVSQHTPSAQ